MKRTIDAEANVLGGIVLAGSQAYWRVSDLLDEDYFLLPLHRSMWLAMKELARAGTPIDIATIADRNPDLEADATGMANATPSAANIRAYAEIVAREAIARRVRNAGSQIAKLGSEDALGEAQRLLGGCMPKAASSIKTAREHLSATVKVLKERCDAEEMLTGVPTSLEPLDELTSGWQRGDLILIGARPSVGKTMLALQAAIHAAEHGHNVLFLSLEMSGEQLCERMLAHIGRVDFQHIRQPKRMDDVEWLRVTNAGNKIETLPLLIDDSCGLTLEAVGAKARQANATKRLGMIVVDYFTKMKPPKADRSDTAWSVVSGGLKDIAKELKIPVVVPCQLNREGTHKPTLKDLRETGSLEQDADVVVFLHRPDESRRDLIECFLGKQRNGPVGDPLWLRMNGPMQRFEITQERPPAKPSIRLARDAA